MRTQQTQSSGNSVSSKSFKEKTVHRSVLLQEVINWLDIQNDDIFFDGTLGAAGHSIAIAKKLSKDGMLIATDVDSVALDRARNKLSDLDINFYVAHENFRDIKKVLDLAGVKSVDKVLLDLGWSSDQIETDNRGMSFMRDEPLSMRLSDIDTESSLTAKEIVNTWGEESLSDVIFGWGEERYARQIAKKICVAREEKEINTTFELVDIIRSAVPASYRNGKIHPATRTFQALRIAVNDELTALSNALESIIKVLSPGGRIAVISFHSLEDRIVKRMFLSWKKDQVGEPLTKKPVTASKEEIEENKRARNAKLRIFKKYD